MLLATTSTTNTNTNTNNIVFVSSFSLQKSHRHHQPVSTIITTTSYRGNRGASSRSDHDVIMYSSSPEQDESAESQSEPSLFLGNGESIENEMKKAKIDAGEYDFGQIDYLALARQRAAAQVESNNNQSKDEEWIALSNEKKKLSGGVGFDDDPSQMETDNDNADDSDWENSQQNDDAGNAESNSLIYTEPPPSTGEDGDDEPKLLLF